MGNSDSFNKKDSYRAKFGNKNIELDAIPFTNRRETKYKFFIGEMIIAIASYRQKDDQWFVFSLDAELHNTLFDTIPEILQLMGERLCLTQKKNQKSISVK